MSESSGPTPSRLRPQHTSRGRRRSYIAAAAAAAVLPLEVRERERSAQPLVTFDACSLAMRERSVSSTVPL